MAGKFTTLNIILLFVTLGSLMFGAWGVMQTVNTDTEDAPIAQGNHPDDERDLDDNPSEDETSGDHKTDDNERRPYVPDVPDKTDTTNNNKAPVKIVAHPDDQGKAQITGKVVDESGNGLSSVTVSAIRSGADIRRPDLDAPDPAVVKQRLNDYYKAVAKQTRTASTDAEGKFIFKGLDEALSYRISASRQGFGRDTQDRVAAGDDIVLRLSPMAALRGAVVGGDGEPLKSFVVRFWRSSRQWESDSRTVTNATGEFEIETEPGDYEVTVEADGYRRSEQTKITAARDSVPVNIQLEQAAVLVGVVSDNSGQPIPNAEVAIFVNDNGRNRWRRGGWNNRNEAKTDTKGRYRLDHLVPGTATEFVAKFGSRTSKQTFTPSVGENKLDFSIDLGATVELHLTKPDGTPVQADSVWFRVSGSDDNWQSPQKLPSEEANVVVYSGLNAGKYKMFIRASGYPQLEKEIDVIVGSNRVDAVLEEASWLTGTVTTTSGGLPSGLTISLRDPEDNNRRGWPKAQAQIGADGRFKVGPVQPGAWKLEVRKTSGWSVVHSEQVQVGVGENEMQVSVNAGAKIVVQIRDATGGEIADANVYLDPVEGREIWASGNANKDAVFEFVEPGEYILFAFGQGKYSKPTKVVVRDGENKLTVQMGEPNCVRVRSANGRGQAAIAGIQRHDLVIEYNGQRVTSQKVFNDLVKQTQRDQDVTIMVDRFGQVLTFTIKGGSVGISGRDCYR